MDRMTDAERRSCHGNPDRARSLIAAGRSCDDCHEPAQTMMLAADSCALVCHKCWRRRWDADRAERASNPGGHMAALLRAMA